MRGESLISFIAQNISNLKGLKNYVGGEFWVILKRLDKLFKFNICYCNNLNIKNILIISFSSLILYKISLLKNCWNLFIFLCNHLFAKSSLYYLFKLQNKA